MEQIRADYDNMMTLASTWDAFRRETASQKRRDLWTPEPQMVQTDDGHIFSLQTIGKHLWLYNPTKWGEAINRVSASEYSEAAYVPNQAKDESVGKRIGEFGTRTIVLIDNKTPQPGTPSTVVGSIRPSFEKLADWKDHSATKDQPTLGANAELPRDIELSDKGRIRSATKYRPTLGTGAELSRDIELSDRDRIRLKLELTRFAIKAFALSDGEHTFLPGTFLVNPDIRPFDNWALYEYLDIDTNPSYRMVGKKQPIVPYHAFRTENVKFAFDCLDQSR